MRNSIVKYNRQLRSNGRYMCTHLNMSRTDSKCRLDFVFTKHLTPQTSVLMKHRFVQLWHTLRCVFALGKRSRLLNTAAPQLVQRQNSCMCWHESTFSQCCRQQLEACSEALHRLAHSYTLTYQFTHSARHFLLWINPLSRNMFEEFQ